MHRQVVMILGPTAVGKTDVAMALQDALGGKQRAQLISADSAMVYRGLDIGAAKPTAQELAAYPHALIDCCDPETPFSAADFVEQADAHVRNALDQQRLPIIVGGTMLYAKRFLEGIAALPEADPELRAALQQQLAQEGPDVLYEELRMADPAAAANIHPNNTQRLLRAVEVLRITEQPISAQWQTEQERSAESRLDLEVKCFGILPDDRGALHARIEARFDAMLANGFLQELEALRARPGGHVDLPAWRAVGYRQGWQYLEGTLSLEQFREKAVVATRQLAKRQLTWLRSWPNLRPLTWGPPDQLAGEILQQMAV